MVTLLNCDCMTFMSTLPDKCFDLAIVDPPYGIDVTKGTWGSSNLARVTDYGKMDWDTKSVNKDILIEIIRVSKNQIFWGANHYISKIPFDSSCWIVWDKLNSADFADCELAYTSFETAVRKFSFRWNGMLQQDMKNKEIRIHPTQKPKSLYKWLLNNYSKQGEKILDTYGGSFSHAIAAYDLGFDLTIMEIDEDYYKAGKERFDAHVAKYSPASEIAVTKKGELKLF